MRRVGRIRRVLVVLAVAALVVVTTTPHAQAPATFTIEPVVLPASQDSGEARLSVQGDRVFVSWLEHADARDTLKFAERTASGWSAPMTVVSGADLMVNSADVPVVHALSGGVLAAAWLQKNGPDPEAYNLRLTRSTDGGRTWSASTTPHHDGTATMHGFPSIFETTGGGFGLVWLDGRSGRDMALRATTYGSEGKQREESAIDARACECCQTSTASTADGPIAVYRDRSPEEIRDISVSRLVAGRWSAPAPVHHDGWKINGCPVNGPAVSASGREVAVAWFSAPSTPGHVFVAFSSDAGRTFGSPLRVDDTSAIGRVQVAWLGDGSVVVSWIDFGSGRSQFRVRRIEKSGARGQAATIAEGLGTQYPRMVARRDELVFAWAENTRGTTRVRSARASIPAALRRRN